ncbi:MAG TPA: AAA family ATPase, partial [Flavobacteriales bacterium]|nr:AAA family ATPase [Flavobacteriales bacterium]
MSSLIHSLLATLGHEPTPGQHKAIDALDRLLSTPKDRATLILKGYAGTGKTTLVGALVKVLAQERRKVILLAPTGRAAKVLSAYAQAEASTIHRRIYSMGDDDDFGGGMRVKQNKDVGALFVVDEASMIGSGRGEGGKPAGDGERYRPQGADFRACPLPAGRAGRGAGGRRQGADAGRPFRHVH